MTFAIFLNGLPLLTGEKVGKVGKFFPTFIWKASRWQITLFLFTLRINTGMLQCGYNGGMRYFISSQIEITKKEEILKSRKSDIC